MLGIPRDGSAPQDIRSKELSSWSGVRDVYDRVMSVLPAPQSHEIKIAEDAGTHCYKMSNNNFRPTSHTTFVQRKNLGPYKMRTKAFRANQRSAEVNVIDTKFALKLPTIQAKECSYYHGDDEILKIGDPSVRVYNYYKNPVDIYIPPTLGQSATPKIVPSPKNLPSEIERTPKESKIFQRKSQVQY
jgi:hypothetical protein